MTRFAVATIALAGVAALFYAGWRRGAPDAVALSEALVREALTTRLGLEVEWQTITLSLDPASVALGGVRAVSSREPEAIVRAEAVLLRPDPTLLDDGVLELRSAHFRGLRVQLPGAPAGRSLALRELEVTWASTGSPTVSGGGDFDRGGTVQFEIRGADPAEIDARFSKLPADRWAALVPELRDATGTISGRLLVEIGGEGVEADARDEASRGERAVVPIVGSFEIDATGAGLVVGGAYRKPKGDPATLVGRFARGSRGGFEVGEIQLSVRKANR